VGELHLARDLADKRVVDRNNRDVGRVDRVVLAQPRNGMAQVIAVEIGPTPLATRVHPVLGRIARALEHVFQLEEGRPVRVPVEQIDAVDETVKLSMAAGETAALAVERRLRRIVRHFPGA
jgi:sporulation protein YlmC with PRC-barrel domain